MKFKKGHYYKWIGPQEMIEACIPKSISDIWKQGNKHKCQKANYRQGDFIFTGITNDEYKDHKGWHMRVMKIIF